MQNKCVIVKGDAITIGEQVILSVSSHENSIVIHSCIQALLRANRENTVGATAYLTHLVCLDCAKALVYAGIKKVVYKNEIEDRTATEQLLIENGIEVVHNPDLNN